MASHALRQRSKLLFLHFTARTDSIIQKQVAAVRGAGNLVSSDQFIRL